MQMQESTYSKMPIMASWQIDQDKEMAVNPNIHIKQPKAPKQPDKLRQKQRSRKKACFFSLA